MTRGALMVIAKEPRPGAVKTRLCPPCTYGEAAALAEAALRDTLDAVATARTARRIVVLEGSAPAWLDDGFEVLAQRGAGLGQRLAAAFADCGGPGFVVAMDTPQVTAGLLDDALDRLEAPGTEAVVGPTPDGGYWGIGFASECPGAFTGVPMSTTSTLVRQLARLTQVGVRTDVLAQLEDVDTITDARRVATVAPDTRFARVLERSGHFADREQPVPEAAA